MSAKADNAGELGSFQTGFVNSGEHTQGCSILHFPPPPFSIFHSVSFPFLSKYFCWFILVHVTVLEVAQAHYHESGLTSWALSPTSLPDANETGTHV